MSEQNEQQPGQDDVALENILGLMVHSYNNYLAGMLGFTELALMEVEQDEVLERLELSLDSGKEAVVFGKQILSAIGRLQIDFKPVDILPIIKEIAQSREDVMIGLQELEAVVVSSDAQWLWHCLESLSVFAHDYSPQSEFQWQVNLKDQILNIAFHPSQVEFNQQQKDSLFMPFYSSRELLSRKDVGLAVVKGFVTQMGGSIVWENQKGFVIQLPVVK